jgi:hypothetical protein
MKACKTDSKASLVDVLDRVLDKGIVLDVWVQVSLVGIDLVGVDARVLVASIATYLQYSDMVAQVGTAARPLPQPATAEPARAATPRAVPSDRTSPAARRARPRRARARKVALLCQDGCTVKGRPGIVPCPFLPDRSCELRAV